VVPLVVFPPPDGTEGWLDVVSVGWLDGAAALWVSCPDALGVAENVLAVLVLVVVLPLVALPPDPPPALVVSQLALTLLTGGVPGGSICAGGVPGVALTVNVSVVPLRSVAVTLQGSAEAGGASAGPIPNTTRAIAASDTRCVTRIEPRYRLSYGQNGWAPCKRTATALPRYPSITPMLSIRLNCPFPSGMPSAPVE
jgi:hypothetical protein